MLFPGLCRLAVRQQRYLTSVPWALGGGELGLARRGLPFLSGVRLRIQSRFKFSQRPSAGMDGGFPSLFDL